ncbi:MAG: type II secretion system secretin GspD, partial [Dehalococcoidia bacterium]
MIRPALLLAWLLLSLVGPGAAWAQGQLGDSEELLSLDFQDTELADVIHMISRLTGKNFLFDDRVRGRVTVVSPTPVTPDEAYRVFEAILQVKGFTTVPGPGGILKIVPVRQAKESPIAIVSGERAIPNRDLYITRLLPLNYVKAETIISTLRPLISNDANLIAYGPTNTLIITDTSASIRRLLTIIAEIDIETYQEQIKVLPIEYADAAGLTAQLREIFSEPAATARGQTPAAPRAARRTRQRGAAAAKTGAAADTIVGQAGAPRFITDDRTNSIIVLAPQATINEVERLVALLDYERKGTGKIHVYRLQNADAEELAQTLASLVQAAGSGRRPAAGQAPAQAAAVVARLGEGINVTADAPTNSLIIQASPEGYAALQEVIQALDIRRPQVLVEALIMEVDVNTGEDFGLAWLFQTSGEGGESRVLTGSANATTELTSIPSALAAAGESIIPTAFTNFTTAILGRTVTVTDREGNTTEVPIIQAIISAQAKNSNINIISAPIILTADNEEAQINVGENIPIPTSRSQNTDVASAPINQNIERQDVGVELRVTPQISEGDTIRLQIFQEISQVQEDKADESLGPTLIQRTIENTVYVRDGEAVMIGGILQETETDSISKIPFLGDIPILGWAFKSTSTSVRKTNLLVILTPKIVRDPDDLNRLTVEHRER